MRAPLSNLLADLIADFSDPSILWQAVAIVVCAALGWVAAGLVRRAWLHGREPDTGVLRIGMESFARVLAPLLVVGLLSLAKLILARYHLHVNLLRVALPIFTSLAVIRIAFYLLRRGFARHGQLGHAFHSFERVFALLVWLGVAIYLTGLWPELYAYLDHTLVPLGRHKASLADILQGAVSVVVLMMLALWAGAALEERLMGVAGFHTSLRVVLARMGRAVLILVAVLFSLSLVGLDLTVLSVFGGALGVGLGLGMQRIASNYVSGFIILLERSLSIGDPITVDKYSGKVTRINTRYSVLVGADGTQTLLPNEMLISGVVKNESTMNRATRVVTRITVSYDSDLDTVLPLLQAQAVGVPRVLADPVPAALLNAFLPDGYELELAFFIGDPENGKEGVISDINKKIYALVRSGAIKLGTPATDTRLLDAHIASVLARISQTDAI